MDDSRLSDGWGEISEKGFQWLEKTLADHKDEPTFIFSHHPNALGGPDIGKQTTARFRAIMDKNPQIIACVYGHKHRAKIVMLKSAGGEIPQIIVPSTKEYPSGFGIVRVYQSGMVYNFHRTDCADCLEWSAITRHEYYGLAPVKLLGKLSDRNMVYQFPDSIQKMERP
jgi:3',5'-cyclic AMP phosphodiesterase CpdA